MAYKLEVIKSVYLFSTFNEKACNALTQDMSFANFRYGDVILPYDRPVTELYIVKQGSVRLQRLKLRDRDDIENKLMLKSMELSSERDFNKYMASDFRKDTDFEDFCYRGQWQTIGEEYFYNRQSSQYRVVVNSADAIIVTIPYHLISTTLSTFEMFSDIMRQKIVEKTGKLQNWHDSVDERKKKIEIARPIIKKPRINLEGKLLNKPKPKAVAINKLLKYYIMFILELKYAYLKISMISLKSYNTMNLF